MHRAAATSDDTETQTPVVVLVAEFYALGSLLQVLERMQEQDNDTRGS